MTTETEPRGAPPAPPLSPEGFAEIARRGAAQLARLVQPDGRFIHAFRLFDGTRDEGYDPAAHSAAVWAMVDVGHRHGMSGVTAAAARAQEWLHATLRRSGHGGSYILGEGEAEARLGTTARAALASIALHEAGAGEAWLDAAEEFCGFLLARRRAGASFEQRIDPGSGTALQQPAGEDTAVALFALTALETHRPDPSRLAALDDSLGALAAESYGIYRHGHGMMYALAAAAPITDPLRAELHGARIVDHILSDTEYRRRRLSIPIARRSEALAGYLRLSAMAPEREAIPELRQAAAQAALENLRLQREWFAAYGAFVKGDLSDRVEISCIQHNIASFDRMARLFEPGGGLTVAGGR